MRFPSGSKTSRSRIAPGISSTTPTLTPDLPQPLGLAFDVGDVERGDDVLLALRSSSGELALGERDLDATSHKSGPAVFIVDVHLLEPEVRV